MPEAVVLRNPSAPNRLGEDEEIEPVLEFLFENIACDEGHGTIEAGDILTAHARYSSVILRERILMELRNWLI